MKKENPVWNFFASVNLALVTLGFLSITSILGTIIPQKESSQFYIKKYGQQTADLFSLFDIPDMYNSWWFLGLLGLLSLNLIVCSLDRIPRVMKLIRMDNLALPLEKILRMKKGATLTANSSIEDVESKLMSLISQKGWTPESRKTDDANVLFFQKGGWSRTGVYIVHVSILVIFLGAIFGYFTGFKGSIMLPELQSSTAIYPFYSNDTIDLGFEVRCDKFDIDFYQNGMVKEYTSDLTVLEDGKEVLKKSIEVNDPLKYKGITFYQSSYQSFRDFIFTISEKSEPPSMFFGSYQKEIIWDDKNISFGIINLESMGDRVTRVKIWFNQNDETPSQFWVNTGNTVNINRPETKFTFTVKQRYATGLQVAKDPGVWIVYLGCTLMLAGLYIAFFMSHRRMWLVIRQQDKSVTIEFRGTTNKNKPGFDTVFKDFEESIEENV